MSDVKGRRGIPILNSKLSSTFFSSNSQPEIPPPPKSPTFFSCRDVYFFKCWDPSCALEWHFWIHNLWPFSSPEMFS